MLRYFGSVLSFLVFWILTEHNAWIFKDSYLSSVLLRGKIFFLASFWDFAIGAFLSLFLSLVFVKIGAALL